MADIVPIRSTQKIVDRANKTRVRRVLNVAKGFTEVLVIGLNSDSEIDVRGHLNSPENAIWLIEMAKLKLLGR